MSKEQYPYPEDEFDHLGASRQPKGVHREPASKWAQWLPYILVIVLVPLLTFGVVRYFAPSTSPEPTPTASESVTGDDEGAEGDDDGADEPDPGADDEGGEGADEGEDPDSEAGADETEAQDPEGDGDQQVDLDYSTSVLILNGASIQGFAGEAAENLADQGWTNTEADNYTNAAPTATTLYYTSEEFEAEARDIAEHLGIDNVIEDASAASNGVVIVLRADFTLPE